MRPRTWRVGSDLLILLRSRGFTLLEILVVLSLAALLLALAAPMVSNMLPGVQVRGAAQELAATLRYSRSRAVSSGHQSQVFIDLDKRQFRVSGREKNFHLPEGVTIDAVVAESRVLTDDGRVASIQFFPDGSSTGGLVTLLDGERGRYQVGVDWLTGRVRFSEGP